MSKAPDLAKLSHATRRRLQFIDFRLHWDGFINRSDLVERFGVSTPQSSNDISLYRALAPDNLEYDSRKKQYIASEAFKPLLTEARAEDYLLQLRALSRGLLIDDLFIPDQSPAGVVPIIQPPIRAPVFRALIRAIRQHKAIDILCCPNGVGDYETVRIAPHAFGSQGGFWFVRAYATRLGKFANFGLFRIRECGAVVDAAVDPAEDWRWHSTFGVVLEPSPRLRAADRSRVAEDFEMIRGRLTVPVRFALLRYFERSQAIASGLNDSGDPLLVIANRREFDAALAQGDPDQ